MAQVGIVMGSDSDLSVMKKAAEVLEELGISYDMRIISAHREPDVFFEYAKGAEAAGMKVIIAGAGMAAHLPGMCAALFPLPVILAISDEALLQRLKDFSQRQLEEVQQKDAHLQEVGYKNY